MNLTQKLHYTYKIHNYNPIFPTLYLSFQHKRLFPNSIWPVQLRVDPSNLKLLESYRCSWKDQIIVWYAEYNFWVRSRVDGSNRLKLTALKLDDPAKVDDYSHTRGQFRIQKIDGLKVWKWTVHSIKLNGPKVSDWEIRKYKNEQSKWIKSSGEIKRKWTVHQNHIVHLISQWVKFIQA